MAGNKYSGGGGRRGGGGGGGRRGGRRGGGERGRGGSDAGRRRDDAREGQDAGGSGDARQRQQQGQQGHGGGRRYGGSNASTHRGGRCGNPRGRGGRRGRRGGRVLGPQGQFRNVERLTYESARNENNKAVARGTLQNNRGGGSQDNGADLPNVPHGKIMTVTDGQNAVGVINQVIHNSGSKRALLFCMPDEREEVKRIKIARDSGEGYGNSAGALTVWHPSGVSGGQTRECCGSCGQYTHELESCVRPEKDGTLHGCPMCNCSGHNVEECSQWAKMSLEEKFKVLVDNRGRMVPLYTAKEELWYQILERRCRRKGESLGMPEFFPYTREFGKEYCEDEEELRSWEEFYEQYDRSIMRIDNKTRDAKSVRKLFSGAAYQSAPSRSEEQTMEIDYCADVNADGDPEGEAVADDLMSVVDDDGGNGEAATQDKVADLAENLGATTLAKNGKVEGRVKTAPLPAQDEDLIDYFDKESDT